MFTMGKSYYYREYLSFLFIFVLVQCQIGIDINGTEPGQQSFPGEAEWNAIQVAMVDGRAD